VFDASFDKGLRFHAAGEAEGSWRIIETWDSREGLGRFIQEDLAPQSTRQAAGKPLLPGQSSSSTSISRTRSDAAVKPSKPWAWGQ
jgi:hypothetical protein